MNGGSYIINNKVKMNFVLMWIKSCKKNAWKQEKTFKIIWWIPEIVVPLHPLNEKCFSQSTEERVLWKISINRQVVQEASTFRSTWVIWTNRQWISWMRIVVLSTENFLYGKKIFLQWRVWSWLRMNASYRLNTCKSRGSMGFACKPRWRPAHGWVTRIQPSP